MVKTKEEKAEYDKKYREKNKEKLVKQKKEYAQSEEGKKVQQKSHQKYYQENKEKISEHMKKYKQTPAGIKSSTLSNWKKNGLIDPDMDELYDKKYLTATHCEYCKKEFENSFDRCMDHDHQTGLFRAFLCRSCNTKDVLS